MCQFLFQTKEKREDGGSRGVIWWLAFLIPLQEPFELLCELRRVSATLGEFCISVLRRIPVVFSTPLFTLSSAAAPSVHRDGRCLSWLRPNRRGGGGGVSMQGVATNSVDTLSEGKCAISPAKMISRSFGRTPTSLLHSHLISTQPSTNQDEQTHTHKHTQSR